MDLLAKVKSKIAELDHWSDKPETKAIVDNLVRNTLLAELPESYDKISIATAIRFTNTSVFGIKLLYKANNHSFCSVYASKLPS